MKIIVFIFAIMLVVMFAGPLADQISYAVMDMTRDPYRVDESAALYGALAGAATYGILIGSLIYLYRKLWPKETNPDQALEATDKNQPVASSKYPYTAKDLEATYNNQPVAPSKYPYTAKDLEDKQIEKSNTADREDLVSIATRVDKKEKKSAIGLKDEYPNAKTVIEYEASAASFWRELEDFSESLRIKFLKSLDEKPQQDVALLYAKIKKDYEAELNPYKDDETNEAYQKAIEISDEAKLEFEKVYKLLGNKVSSEKILEKIRSKFGIDTSQQLSFKYFDGWEERLLNAIQTRNRDTIHQVLEQLGYRVETNSENSKVKIIRPAGIKTALAELTYVGNHELMAFAESEQFVIRRHFEDVRDIDVLLSD